MKKLIPALTALLLLFPAPAAADWKEEIISELKTGLAKFDEKIGLSEIPGAKTGAALGVYNAMSGICIGFTGTSQLAPPEPVIELSVRMHEQLLRGNIPGDEEISRLGLGCLTFIEDSLIKTGLSKADVENHVAPVTRRQLQFLFQQLGVE